MISGGSEGVMLLAVVAKETSEWQEGEGIVRHVLNSHAT